jgi:lon-related putative ATP-dependent protease
MNISNFTKEMGFSLEKTQAGIVARPVGEDGKFMTEEEFSKLTEEEKDGIGERQAQIQKKMDEAAQKETKNEKNFKEDMSKFEDSVVLSVASPIISLISKKYKYKKLNKYFKDLKENLGKHKQVFLIKEKDTANEKTQAYLEYVLAQYKVNLFIDSTESTSAPIVFERNPTFNNLFGWIEHEEKNGYLSTNFSKIKPGSIHKANGGYLIIQVLDLLKNSLAYDELKRTLRNQSSKVGENPFAMYSLKPLKKLEPEDIDLDIKVILIGSSQYFAMLNRHDEEFSRLFKVKADFDHFVYKNEETLEQFFKFLKMKTEEKEIMPLNKGAVAELIDYSTKIAGQHNRLTSRLSKLEDILYEANYLASKENKRVISRENIEETIKNKDFRNGKFKQLIHDSVHEGTTLINITGESVGEINGLAVYSIDDFSFGIASKITSRSYAGKAGVINIERDAKLSGKIHDKGIGVLSGYLSGLFRNITPLSLSVSISFEQNYGGVDGDSASSTETYAILSSLSGYPIKQNIAVTGSVNQMGFIQPIGGVNDKIEGFFAICKHDGLTGEQGVIIPIQNVKNLMLSKEVVEAVKDEKFHIYAVSKIEEGIEILTGKPFGKELASGGYTKNSILDKSYKTLMKFVVQSSDQVKVAKKALGIKEDKDDEKEDKKEKKAKKTKKTKKEDEK